MPTGYTAKITDGISFEQFVMDCSRAFGALIEMRDEPMSTSIPEEFKPSDYDQKRLEEAKEKLLALSKITLEEAQERADVDREKQIASNLESIAKQEDLLKKYKAMLKEVLAWQPPSPDHTELKSFMVQQITDSIKWDCGSIKYYTKEVPKITGAEWLKNAIESANHDIQYHTEEDREEKERTEGRNKWVRQLRESLK